MLLNYYCVAVAVLVGAVSGFLAVRWLRGGLGGGRMLARAAGVGFGGTVLFGVGGLAITGVDGFTLIHVAYVVGTVGVPLAGGMVLLWARPRPGAVTAACVLALAAAPVGVYATHVEPFWLKVDAVELAVEGVNEPIRIGVLADLQTTAIGDYERNATERLLGFGPDIVVLPGDLYQFDAELLDERAPQFTQLIERIVDEVPLVYLVSGNTDTVAGLRQITAGTGARVLDNEIDTFELNGVSVSIGGTTLFGDDAAARRMAQQLVSDEQAAGGQAGDSQAGVRILLGHKPDAIELVRTMPVHLLVAGHTHGGQVSLPIFGPPLTLSNVPRHIAAGGLNELDGTPIYVSTGVGRERGNAPQLRLGARPSIGIIDLVSDGSALE
ncbi:metallophosphoesterase [Candidatus Poriferisodalis sp.]|uniref:metallophosphoesterase n=1 Tax=Candidatus Poriferisodalis sp. TaxID=3101277 RepID=UPI003B530507